MPPEQQKGRSSIRGAVCRHRVGKIALQTILALEMSPKGNLLPGLSAAGLLLLCLLQPLPAQAMDAAGGAAAMAWWVWPLALFFACFLMGIVAVPAGIGGGTLFVPIVGGLFPFHLDFVRGAGLLVALGSALSAGPMLLRSGLASLRLGLPLGLLASISSIAGALLGLVLPPALVQTALGLIVLGIVLLMVLSPGSEFPNVPESDPLARALALHGVFMDGASRREISWQAHRTPMGLLIFVVIGILGGLFGIGAGWANVPALNLLMGVPIKVAAGSSSLVLTLASSSAAWVYLNKGAMLPMIAVPSVLGMMLGARIGARLLDVLEGSVIRRMVIAVLLFAGLRALLKGTGVWA
jgi:uncharacterized membrane protein YfcA